MPGHQFLTRVQCLEFLTPGLVATGHVFVSLEVYDFFGPTKRHVMCLQLGKQTLSTNKTALSSQFGSSTREKENMRFTTPGHTRVSVGRNGEPAASYVRRMSHIDPLHLLPASSPVVVYSSPISTWISVLTRLLPLVRGICRTGRTQAPSANKSTATSRLFRRTSKHIFLVIMQR